MKEIQAFCYCVGIIIATLWCASDTLARAYLNPIGISCIVAVLIVFFGLEKYFTKNRERAKFGSLLIGFLVVCPFLNLLFFGGDSISVGGFLFLYVYIFFVLCLCAGFVMNIWEPIAMDSELEAQIEEEHAREQAELIKKFEESNTVQHNVQSFAYEEVKNTGEIEEAGTQNNLQGQVSVQVEAANKTMQDFQTALYNFKTNSEDEKKNYVEATFEPYRPYDYKPQTRETVSSPSDERKYFVKVKFPGSKKTYDYLCSDIMIDEGDVVVVPNKGGTKRATVVDSFFSTMDDMPLAKHKYKKIIGLADDEVEYDEDDWDGYCVDIKFHATGKSYTYRCPFPDVDEGDFVRVRALGKIETVKVVRTFYDDLASMSMVLAKATDHQIDKVSEKFEDDDEELSWEEKEEIRRDMEEDEHRRALEEAEEWREIRAEEARNRQIAEILAYQASSASSYSSSKDDDWTQFWNNDDDDDDGRIFDSRGNMINGKLREYDRRVREASRTGFAKNGMYVVDTEYRQELMDGYRYCDEHEEYDDCHYGHDDDSYDSSYDDDDFYDNRDDN